MTKKVMVLNYEKTEEYKKRVNNVLEDFNKLEAYFKRVIQKEKGRY